MTLRRLLWLLVGFIYRLIVLVLFERWIPFPQQPPAPQPKPDAPRKQRRGVTGSAPVRPRPAPRARSPIFDVRLTEPAPERVAALESEHLDLRAHQQRAAAHGASSGRPLRALLRDRHALRSALVLGEALADRRYRPK